MCYTVFNDNLGVICICSFSSRLVHLRRRDAVYVRSSHGLSLQKAKVVSVGGSNLKWSKSIERRSKKANEVFYLSSLVDIMNGFLLQ